MNLRETNRKNYENALKAYQEQIVEIAILEYELKSLKEKKASKEAYDNLSTRIAFEYDELAVLAQAVTDTFKAFQEDKDVEKEEVEAEKIDLSSLESTDFSDRYYEVLDRYDDQLDHIEQLETELTEIIEKHVSEEEIKAKRREISEAYEILAILSEELNEEADRRREEELTLDDIRKEIDEAIDAIKEEPLTEEDKQIMKELEIEEFKRLQEETEEYKKDLKANIKRKGELIRKANAKEENLKGFDEAIRQLEEKIRQNSEELKYYMEKYPELKQEEKHNENKKGLGFRELSKYLQSYLYMQSTVNEKVNVEITDPYEDQKNVSITLNLGSGYTYHYSDARNPKTGESYGYICWIAHKKDNGYLKPEDFANSADVWAEKCDRIFQFRGDRKAGIQVQELEIKEDGNLHPVYVYETKKGKIVKGVVGENSLKTVTLEEMITSIDKRINEELNATIENDELSEFEYDQLEIERLENENQELIKYRNANEKRKLQLIEIDDAKLENLKGFDEVVRQLNEDIKINEEIIASIKAKYPDYYKEEVIKITPQEEEKATKEEIEEAIEEALENVKLAEEEKVDEEILGILNKDEIARIIDEKLNEIYGKDNIDKNIEKNEFKEKEDKLLHHDEITKIINDEMNKVEVDLPVDYEEIFEGTYIIDGVLTPEEQKEKIFNLMERAGVKLTDEEKRTVVISYEGVEDNDGLSETQSTRFTVRKPIEKVPYKEPIYIKDYYRKKDNTRKYIPHDVKEDKKEEKEKHEEKEYEKTSTNDINEKLTLYIDLDNQEVYGNDYLFKRFHLDRKSNKAIIDGFACYKMNTSDAEYIIKNQNNSYSPYIVETREVRMGKKEDVIKVRTKEEEKANELANEMSIAEKYMLILHPEYKHINKLDREEQRNLLIDYWYIRDNYKDIHNLFTKMKQYYSGADIDDKSLLISILPKYVVEQEVTRRKERGEEYISEKEYKDAIYKGLANKDRYLPEWSYTETMLSEISGVNTKHAMESQRIEINKDFHVDKPEIIKPTHKYRKGIDSLENLRKRINVTLRNYQEDIMSLDEAIHELAKIFKQNTEAINFALESHEDKDKIRHALMNIINDRNNLYEMCGIIAGELTDNEQIQYLNLEDAFKITDLDGVLYEDIVTYLMSTLLIQQTESQIIVDSKVVDFMKSNNKVR